MSKIIKMYSTPTCPWCRRLKKYLDEQQVDYTEFDVSKDQQALIEMVKKSGQLGVPQIDIGGKVIVGFDRETIDEELKSA
ncbi:MAG: NrdH-redoxin [Candidatus Margulisiibacteriota bacterium]|nr:MAG: NrdH-redoxin [Candidatus Margulisbacteria bacterium GWD2_39_127]OGI01406.1 MAG: NrdH-redoxin [Candidatus Margulisbacteria bacterium GWF2_38_17]OGI10324.1 MAG: NrdH-redoxin [Candidatus Margulisbacteria bacterium GWE2_39_32]PZM84969.1 MAG: NrdH-redoxin [Candidatus Margulisiibacteriota bacterium]HAR62011.1 NrdH-redoxin [Candidatus Margulisiibacteriota bacterium]